MDTVTGSALGLSISSRSERACVIAALSGELGITALQSCASSSLVCSATVPAGSSSTGQL
jgi:hypothetical protein